MAKELIIKTQKQLDAIKADFEGVVYIEGGTEKAPLSLTRSYESAEVIVRGQAWIVMGDSSTVQRMGGSSTVQRMGGSSTVQSMWDSSTVQSMGDSSTVQSMGDSSTVQSMGDSSTVQRMGGSSTVQSMGGSSTVQRMGGSSTVQRMGGSSTVQRMGDSSTVQSMGDSSTVQSMGDSSTVQRMWDSSTVQRMGGSSTVQSMGGSSTAKELFGEASIGFAYGTNSIVCKGYNVVRTSEANKKNLTLVMSKESHLIVTPNFVPTIEEYMRRYPVVKKGKKLTLYKAVHKDGDIYRADYRRSFTYEIGKKVEHENAPQKDGACAKGLHVSHKDWAIRFGIGWEDLAILECEVPADKIVVANDCDGKVRTSELKVIREVPKDEYYTD